MSNHFVFIIPLTPDSHLTELRSTLQKICLETLLKQTYQNWTALLIGRDKPSNTEDPRFVHIAEEGLKELKLQIATKYIRENALTFDYVIRLDDDDIINPSALQKYKNSQADAIVDLKHHFLDWHSQSVSSQFRPWFPNTILHKFEHAMVKYGKIANRNIEQINDDVVLIETNHSYMHDYYKGKKVLFSAAQRPVYVRVLNKDSITSSVNDNYLDYLRTFGTWNKKLAWKSQINITPDQDQACSLKKKNMNLKSFIGAYISQSRFKKDFK
ncbi:MAG: hypothetical protein AB8B80_16705 [Marinicellaceae bacterium]